VRTHYRNAYVYKSLISGGREKDIKEEKERERERSLTRKRF
jgi:hypothetical protein